MIQRNTPVYLPSQLNFLPVPILLFDHKMSLANYYRRRRGRRRRRRRFRRGRLRPIRLEAAASRRGRRRGRARSLASRFGRARRSVKSLARCASRQAGGGEQKLRPWSRVSHITFLTSMSVACAPDSIGAMVPIGGGGGGGTEGTAAGGGTTGCVAPYGITPLVEEGFCSGCCCC